MLAPEIADRQAGAFTRRQARAEGIAWSTIRRRLAAGSWKTVIPGVLAAESTAITTRTRAWAGHLVTGGVVSWRTAAALHSLAGEDDRIHVISPRQLHVRAAGVVDHRTRLAPEDVVVHEGLPVTTFQRTLVDLLAGLPVQDARTLLFRAVQQRWIEGEGLLHAIARRRHMTGTNQLRDLHALIGTGAHSVAELALHRILDGVASLEFLANARLEVAGKSYVVDVLIPAHRIVVEVDGRKYHSSPDQFVRDRRRQNDLVGAGYTVLRFTWLDLVEGDKEVQRSIRRAIAVSL